MEKFREEFPLVQEADERIFCNMQATAQEKEWN